MNAPISIISRSRRPAFVRIAGGVVALGGGVVLAGWLLGIEALTYLIPGAVTMMANTALAFILSGGALFLLQMSGPWARRAAVTCAALAGALALGTLVEYATGGDFGIDELLVRDGGLKVATPYPGRMGVNTAVSFVLTTMALGLMSRSTGNGRRLLALGWLGGLVLGLGLFALLGYAAEFSLGHGWWSLAGMAVHTAALFVLLGTAVLHWTWREAGRRWLIDRKSVV